MERDAVLRGTGGGRSLLLNGHMDIVGVEGIKIHTDSESYVVPSP